MKERADKVVVDKGLAESRQKAQALIMAGRVFAGRERIEKPGQKVFLDTEIFLKEGKIFVSRGGLKLNEALDVFQVPVEKHVAADLGSSTGGFTDCLLQRGARKVYAVDVDTRQIDWRLRKDPRVVLIEKNARFLKKEDFDDPLDVVAVDLSFISVLKILPAVKTFVGDGKLLALIKPQFEAGKGQVGKKGIIRHPSQHEEIIRRMIDGAKNLGFQTTGLLRASLKGIKGNQEFFLLWSLVNPPLQTDRLEKLIKEAVWDEKN
jgi:23S rRNA (cytidine1920-2'-O)/16S rRNA (cytidine1409-2'-O)-methyltransferase